jgi:hypothetical protein
LTLHINSQNKILSDTLITVSSPRISGFPVRFDTLSLQSSNDNKLINRTWYLDQFYSSLNDSISFLFRYGIEKTYLRFSKNWDINAYDGCYGFGGVYKISNDKRILIKQAASNCIYCKKDTLNYCYQQFWRSFVHILHESRYVVANDSLILYHQTGYVVLLDSSKVSTEYIKNKKIPDNTNNKTNVDELIKKIMQEK